MLEQRAGRHFRGRNDRMWARSRITTRCFSLRWVLRKEQRMWGKDDEFCLAWRFEVSVGHSRQLGSLRTKGKF